MFYLYNILIRSVQNPCQSSKQRERENVGVHPVYLYCYKLQIDITLQIGRKILETFSKPELTFCKFHLHHRLRLWLSQFPQHIFIKLLLTLSFIH